MTERSSKWKFSVDQGGTFTDVVALDPMGGFHTLKLLSRSSQYRDASIEGIRKILGTGPERPLPEDRIEGIRFGTTVATNALLERKGCRVALFITKGFADLLEIGYQRRPEIFDLCIKKAPPVYSKIIEVDERTDCRGEVVKDFDSGPCLERISEINKDEVDAVAVVFMHSWKNPEHELLCERMLLDEGFTNIFLSHRCVNLIKIISRGQSTLIDAYLSEVLALYMKDIKKATGGIPIEFMQSSGVPSPPEAFTGKSALLSGPAGGLIAVAGLSEEKNIEGVIGFDMGGTSTDVSRFDGNFERIYEHEIGGIPLQTEMLNIVTVAAGGGSVLGFDGQRMTTGPESAGAYPGPACYGFAGPLTVTDANLLTGRIVPAYFPRTFGPDGKSSLDTGIVKEKFLDLAGEINNAMSTELNLLDTANGFLRLANEKMAMAIKEISVSKGFDVRDYALVCFGGAGGQHACGIASLLEIDTIIIHPLSSVMSAYGIGLSQPAWKREKTILKQFTRENSDELAGIFEEMGRELSLNKLEEEKEYIKKYKIDLRPMGTETFLTLEYGDFQKTLIRFSEQYRRLFGFVPSDTPLEIVNLKLEVRELSEFFARYSESHARPSKMSEPVLFQEISYPGKKIQAPVYLRESLSVSAKIQGPAFIIDTNSTVIIDPDFEAEINDRGVLNLTRNKREINVTNEDAGRPDPVLLEVFNNLFMGTATEMGLVLQNTAHSVNMKERLDFSCAIFESDGGLVANAPHIPVHLGSMADTVKAVIDDKGPDMKPGDIYLSNNPYRGGSHLPDMTVVCPVFSETGVLIFFTAARGHHSDIGGTTPGSMPPDASHIDEEGVLIDSFLLVRDGIFREDDLKKLLQGHAYPVRNVSERIADIRAQIAACHKGTRELLEIILKYGLETVSAYMEYIQEHAEYAVKNALLKFISDNNIFHSNFEDFLDDGTPVKASVSIDGGSNPPETLRAVIDFNGTGSVHLHDNLNAPLSVVNSAVMYVLRTLIKADIPLNSGCLKPVDILVPKGTVLNPVYPAPVATGNVETSQRVVDVLLGAFGVAGASQGTMNNLLFEVEGETPYYETIAGGAGAVEGCDGASGVQVHMTNTRMTDPEILELRHPGVRIEQFTERENSGGKGRFAGGDGVVREIKFLKPATVSILSERRVYAPYGMEGGAAGLKGINILKKADGSTKELGHREVLHLDKDDSVIIESPGGGGFGCK